MALPEVYLELEKIFFEHGYKLFMVGGASRDYLMGLEVYDFDLATDATPEEMKEFINFENPFVSLGSISFKYKDKKIDITTMRVEGEYKDYRHPESIKFVKSLRMDAKRRDFALNAIYIDKNGKKYDFYHGLDDLDNHLISMVGKADERLKEDPLRILRALRFSLIYDYSLTPSLREAVDKNMKLLKKISYQKAMTEIKKMRDFDEDKANWLLKIHKVDHYIPLDNNYKNRLDVIDMHCDTITKKEFKKDGYFNDLHLNFFKMAKGEYLAQCFAIFLPLKVEKHPFEKAKSYYEIFKKQIAENNSIISQVTSYQELINNKSKQMMSAILTLEEGGIIEGSLEKLEEVYSWGVRMMTLTWNYENEIGYPNINYGDGLEKVDRKNKNEWLKPHLVNTEEKGLKPFGIQVVKKMNELGMIIDVSHGSDALFYDVIKYSSKPIVASHSNSRSVYNHKRNLTDDMIRALAKNGGVIGINYCPEFVSKKRKTSQIPDLVKHINHIREVGGIDVIALGSDFDGIDTPVGMSDCTKTLELKEALIEAGYSPKDIKKIFHDNFLRVFKANCSK
jgi:membrane dipeptidase